MSERRETLKIIGAVTATCAFPFSADELYGQHAHPEGVAAALPEPKYFSKTDFAVVARIADLIIPRTSSPGAIDAGVPAYIDMVVGGNKQQQAIFRDGLAWLKTKAGGKKFVELSEPRQLAILRPLCEAVDQRRVDSAGEKMFRAMKSLTADGYYTSKDGMVTELGYKGGAVLAAYPECIHEH